MIRQQQPALSILAIGVIGIGTLSVLYQDFAFSWQPVPQFHPGREALAVVCGLFMITVSIALLFRSTVAIASRALFLFLIAWLCLKVPAVIAAPQIQGVWIGFGEIGMLLAGGWCCLHAYLAWRRRSSSTTSRAREAFVWLKSSLDWVLFPLDSGTSSMSRSPQASSRRGCLSVWI